MAAINTPDDKSRDPAEHMSLNGVHASAWSNSNLSSFASARRAVLPFDMLSHIFLDCLPDEGFPTLSVKEAPLLLGRVCNHWREVALATPLLWSGLRVVMEVEPTYDRGMIHPQNLAPAIQEWINRGGQCALSCHLTFDPMADDRGMELLNILLPHRRRWKHIQGRLTVGQWRRIFSALARDTPPLFEYLNISSFPHMNKLEIHLSANWMLCTLVVRCRHNIFGLEACGKSLRHISVDVTNLDECLFYFAHCPNLEAFEVQCGSIMEENFLVDSDVACLEMKRMDKLTLKLAYTWRKSEMMGKQSANLLCNTLELVNEYFRDT